MTFGTRLKQLRTETGETQLQISQLLETSKSNISKYEANSVEPSLAMLSTLARHFNVSVDYLLCLSDKRTASATKNNIEDFCPERIDLLLNEPGGLRIDFYSTISKIPEDTLRKYASGELLPTTYDLCKLIETLNTSADYLFGKSDIMHPTNNNHFNSNDDFSRIFDIESEKEGYLKIDLSNELNVSVHQIERLLSGEEMPDPDILYKIAQILKKSTDYLLGLSKKSREPNLNKEIPFEMNMVSLNRIQKILGSDKDIYWCSELFLTEDELYNLYHYGFIPHIGVIQKLCSLSNTSSDYILGLSDSKFTIISEKKNDEESLLKSYRQLDENYKKKLDGLLADQILQQERDSYMRSSATTDNPLKKTGTTNTAK